MTTWIDIAEASGAISATLAFVGGAVISMLYGRKANAEISGIAYVTDGQTIVVTRPSISAVGFHRITFAKRNGVDVKLTEIVQIPGDIRNGRFWIQGSPFDTSFVEAGETLTTTVVFPLGEVPTDVIGWRLSFGLTVQRRPSFSGIPWQWVDETFVPRPR